MKRRVIAVVEDMFFASKIRGTAEQNGVEVVFVRSPDVLFQSAKETATDLVVIDLHSQRCDPFEAAARLKRDESLRSLPIIGFLSHVETELQQRARAAGFDQVLPRSVFTNRLAEILRGEFKIEEDRSRRQGQEAGKETFQDI